MCLLRCFFPSEFGMFHASEMNTDHATVAANHGAATCFVWLSMALDLPNHRIQDLVVGWAEWIEWMTRKKAIRQLAGCSHATAFLRFFLPDGALTLRTPEILMASITIELQLIVLVNCRSKKLGNAIRSLLYVLVLGVPFLFLNLKQVPLSTNGEYKELKLYFSCTS